MDELGLKVISAFLFWLLFGLLLLSTIVIGCGWID